MLEWAQATPYYQASTCGRFTVAKCLVDGRALYVAYDLGRRLGVTDKVREARTLCQAKATEQK
jgi:hypothetical protein